MPSTICRGSPAGGDTTRNRASPWPATSVPRAGPCLRCGCPATRRGSWPRCAPGARSAMRALPTCCASPRRRSTRASPTCSASRRCSARSWRVAEPITVIGAGPVGSLLALFLARRGHHIQVFERRPDMRRVGIGAGRSINLAVSTRGLYALHQVGLEEEVLRQAIPMSGRMVHAAGSEPRFLRYGRDDSEFINSMSRGELNKLLMTEAERTGRVRIEFQQRLVGYDSGRARLRDEHSGEEREVEAPADAERFFAETFPDALALIPRLGEALAEAPLGRMVTVKCARWSRGQAVLIGDAAHAIVPFFGQGMNAGFEDCTVLMEI